MWDVCETWAVNGRSCFSSVRVSRQAAAVILQPSCLAPVHFPHRAGLPSLLG